MSLHFTLPMTRMLLTGVPYTVMMESISPCLVDKKANGMARELISSPTSTHFSTCICLSPFYQPNDWNKLHQLLLDTHPFVVDNWRGCFFVDKGFTIFESRVVVQKISLFKRDSFFAIFIFLVEPHLFILIKSPHISSEPAVHMDSAVVQRSSVGIKVKQETVWTAWWLFGDLHGNLSDNRMYMR